MCWRVSPGLRLMNSPAVLRLVNIQSTKSRTFTSVPWNTATCPVGVSFRSNGGFRFRDMGFRLAGMRLNRTGCVPGNLAACSGERLQVRSRENTLAEAELYAFRFSIKFFERCLAAVSSDVFYNFSPVAGFSPPQQNKPGTNGWMAYYKIREVPVP